MNPWKSLYSLLGKKKARGGQSAVSSNKWCRLHIEELESRDLPSLTPSGLISAASGFDRPTFAWTAVSGADHYKLAVIDNNTGQTSINVANISGTSYWPPMPRR